MSISSLPGIDQRTRGSSTRSNSSGEAPSTAIPFRTSSGSGGSAPERAWMSPTVLNITHEVPKYVGRGVATMTSFPLTSFPRCLRHNTEERGIARDCSRFQHHKIVRNNTACHSYKPQRHVNAVPPTGDDGCLTLRHVPSGRTRAIQWAGIGRSTMGVVVGCGGSSQPSRSKYTLLLRKSSPAWSVTPHRNGDGHRWEHEHHKSLTTGAGNNP